MTLTKQQKYNKIINCLFYPAWNGEEYEGVIQNFLTPVSLRGVFDFFLETASKLRNSTNIGLNGSAVVVNPMIEPMAEVLKNSLICCRV